MPDMWQVVVVLTSSCRNLFPVSEGVWAEEIEGQSTGRRGDGETGTSL